MGREERVTILEQPGSFPPPKHTGTHADAHPADEWRFWKKFSQKTLMLWPEKSTNYKHTIFHKSEEYIELKSLDSTYAIAFKQIACPNKPRSEITSPREKSLFVCNFPLFSSQSRARIKAPKGARKRERERSVIKTINWIHLPFFLDLHGSLSSRDRGLA